jgi:hypothetical protein
MAGRYGVLTLADTVEFATQEGQTEAFQAAEAYLVQYRADLDLMLAVLVERTTEEFSFRYRLPGGGMMQKRRGQSQSHAVYGEGFWDVGLPLEMFEDQVTGDEITLAYMTAEQFDLQVQTVTLRHLNRVRFEVLYAVFNNTVKPFQDERQGTIIVQPLANGDATLYPPVRGTTAEAPADHYIEAGYLPAAISDVNNPIVRIVSRLTGQFGVESGNSNVVVFIHTDEQVRIEGLAGFVEVSDRFLIRGANETTVGAPPEVPGVVIGRSNGAWISVWPEVPPTYMLGIHLDAPKPVLRRVDPARTGLAQGLRLVNDDPRYPWRPSHYRDRFGFGVGNRLNGVVLHLGATGAYPIPALFA